MRSRRTDGSSDARHPRQSRGQRLVPAAGRKKAASFLHCSPRPARKGYTALDFGKYLSLFLLDSDHTHTIAGEQTEWLGKQLSQRRKVPHVIPVYHTPAYPGFREDTGAQAGGSRGIGVRCSTNTA